MATNFIRSNIAQRMSSHNYLVTTSLDFETVHVSLAHQVAMCVCMCPGREGGGGLWCNCTASNCIFGGLIAFISNLVSYRCDEQRTVQVWLNITHLQLHYAELLSLPLQFDHKYQELVKTSYNSLF